MPAAVNDIYQALLESAPLTEEHRAELRKKRGFSDETINALGFRSAGPHLAKVIEELQERFDEIDLVDSGLLTETNGTVVIEQQVLDSRVIIPYLNEEGKPYFLRPHKLGFKGKGIEIYARFFLAERPKQIVITEGEFKAAALWQWGIPAIAIPGISSFVGKHFDRLKTLLNEFDVEKVVVIFDNEVKDNPRLPSYKERPEDRWDTPFWAYVLAAKLKAKGFTSLVGQLPDGWRQNGKIDFDGALALGKTRKEIERVIAQAVLPTEFLDGLGSEAQRIVRRKVTVYFTHSPIRREYNRYVVKDDKDEGKIPKPISNFVIDIKSSFFTPDGCVRYVNFVNEYGEQSDTFVLEPGDMVGVESFRRFCFSKGSYIWQGSTSELQEVWRYELMRDMGDIVHIPEQIGEIRPGFWLFGNLAVYKGEIIRPDSDGIVWIDGTGYKPRSLNVGPRGEEMEDAIPSLHTGDLDVKELMHQFRGALGGGYEACIGVGWIIATLFSRPIFTRYKAFPFPFAHGKREAGKSTFMRWLMAFFGAETEGINLAESSQNYIMRSLSYFSSLGIWYDEYRNEPAIAKKEGYLRSAYNRQLSGKGIKEAFGARSYVVRGTVALSGEELPKDNGLFTRIVPLRVSSNRREREHFEWMQRNMHRFSAFTLQVLRRWHELEPQIMATIKELKAALCEAGITDRAAENWAILAGSYYAVVEQEEDFIKWVYATAAEVRREAEDEHMLSIFWSDIAVMVAEYELTRDYLDLLGDGTLALWWTGLYSRWSSYYRQRTGREAFDRMSVSRYLKEDPCFVAERAVRMHGTVRRAYVVDITKAPDPVAEIAEQLRNREQQAMEPRRKAV